MKLSVIVPSIRPERLTAWCQSFLKSYSGACEIIVVSPHPNEWVKVPLVHWIQDFGHPVRCQQIGLMQATGDLIHRGVDDSLYLPGQMDAAIAKLGADYKSIIAPKYTETNASVDRSHKDFQDMNDPKFYKISYHTQANNPYIGYDYLLLNFAILRRDFMLQVGGWDCQFESVAIAELDLAIRLQMAGGQVVLSDALVLECDWMPGHEGDHGPMHDAFEPDMEKYRQIYRWPECRQRVIIPTDNWRNAPAKWRRRFGD